MLPSQHFDSLLQPGAESDCNNTGCFDRAARRGADRQDSRQKAAVCCAGKAGTSKGGNPSKELIVRSYTRAPRDINAHCYCSDQKEFLSWWDDFPHDGVTSSPWAFCFIPVTRRFPAFLADAHCCFDKFKVAEALPSFYRCRDTQRVYFSHRKHHRFPYFYCSPGSIGKLKHPAGLYIKKRDCCFLSASSLTVCQWMLTAACYWRDQGCL